jgi:hypothetical protein
VQCFCLRSCILRICLLLSCSFDVASCEASSFENASFEASSFEAFSFEASSFEVVPSGLLPSGLPRARLLSPRLHPSRPPRANHGHTQRKSRATATQITGKRNANHGQRVPVCSRESQASNGNATEVTGKRNANHGQTQRKSRATARDSTREVVSICFAVCFEGLLLFLSRRLVHLCGILSFAITCWKICSHPWLQAPWDSSVVLPSCVLAEQ